MKALLLTLLLPLTFTIDPEEVRRDTIGLYLEENVDTTSATTVNKDIAVGLGNQLLDILDLDDLPRPKRSKRDEKMTDFMATFYEKMNEEEKNCMSGKCDLQEWVDADGIVSLSPEKVETLPDGDTYKIRFPSNNVIHSGTKPKSLIVAQLQLFIHGHQNSIKILASPTQGFEKAQVIIMGKGHQHMKMNVSEIIAPWFQKSSDPMLYVRIDNGGDPGLITMEVFVMVAFREGIAQSRPKRSVSTQESSLSSNSVPRKPRRLDPSVNTNPNVLDGCRKQGLYVSFADLGWKEWLIAPEGYAAFFCGGACDFPLHNRMNATNHAIVQTLAHLVDPNRAQKAKCAPVQLSPMKILFVDNNQNVVMRRFRDMVVQECGCH